MSIDKAVITWHIITYFFVVIATIVQEYVYFKYPETYEISLPPGNRASFFNNSCSNREHDCGQILTTVSSSDDYFESDMTASIATQGNYFKFGPLELKIPT